MQDLTELVAELRLAGGDRTDVEVKLAVGGLPVSIGQSLSALSNLPGGGYVLLGIDEGAGLVPVRLPDRQKLKQGLSSRGRSLVPPPRMSVFDATVDGVVIVAARVEECDPAMKPCRTSVGGPAYLRGYDGDFTLSVLEEQAFLAARSAPSADRIPVEGPTLDDLDTDLLDRWTENVGRFDATGLGRFTGDELLRRGGVIDGKSGRVTVAGLLTFGKYPQEWFPRWVVQLAVLPTLNDPRGTRVENAVVASGPIPVMLDVAVDWARRTFGTRVVGRGDGTVRDETEYPLEAFRELIANALIHRDLCAWSEGYAVEVRLGEGRLVVANPGGLFGISVDRLGREAVTSARNRTLISLCRFAETPSGVRVVEALATGLQRVESQLVTAGLPSPRFLDQGIRFTVLLEQARHDRTAPSLSGTAQRVYAVLATGPRSATFIAAELGLEVPNTRRVLRQLVVRRLVVQEGGPGQRGTVYRRTVVDK